MVPGPGGRGAGADDCKGSLGTFTSGFGKKDVDKVRKTQSLAANEPVHCHICSAANIRLSHCKIVPVNNRQLNGKFDNNSTIF